jgi:hypothetical protein
VTNEEINWRREREVVTTGGRRRIRRRNTTQEIWEVAMR